VKIIIVAAAAAVMQTGLLQLSLTSASGSKLSVEVGGESPKRLSTLSFRSYVPSWTFWIKLLL
jgi:hypothetical protein